MSYSTAQAWLDENWRLVEQALVGQAELFHGSHILVTGAAGFLGFNFLHFFSYLNRKNAGRSPVRVMAVDNYLRGKPRWLVELAASDPNIKVVYLDITQPWTPQDDRFDFIIHGASIASPIVYRKYPLETLDANILGLRHMLELARHGRVKSLLYFSSSEIYGNPPASEIPTPETFRGNVACVGPRACYDESKRVGETLCYLYFHEFGVPTKIVRPFNNYGPGLRLTDGRVVSDLCRNVLSGHNIVLRSDGSPTRTFCYSADAIAGYILTLLSEYHAEPFNIGCNEPEISMEDLAGLVATIAGNGSKVLCEPSEDPAYLTDSPKRRCPDITKARSLLGFEPRVNLEFGITRLLEWYRRFGQLEELESL